MSLAAPYQEHYYVADGSTTSFAFGQSFTALNEIDVKCIVYFEDDTNCVPVFNVNMTTGFINIVSLTKPDGTLLTVPPAGSIVRVFRKTPEAQNVTASQLQNYTAKQLERVFDSLVAMIQEVSYSDIHKTVRLTETQRDIAIDYLPDDKDQAVIYWDVEERKLMPAGFGQNQVVKSDGVEWLVYNQSEGKVYFIPRQGGNPIPIGKATIHNDLSGRNAPDCHPESAITGLREHLQELRDKDSEIEEDVQIALNRSQEAKDTADEAKGTAEYAQSQVAEAKEMAIDAKETAEGVEGIAQEAKDIADEALNKVTQEITDRKDADGALQDQIDSLSGRGRFLTLWNCATGLAESNPPESPYPYKAGDYFVVGTVSSADPAVNYKPDGSSYTTGVASTTVETNEVSVNDTYFYDGTVWKLQSNAQKEVSFSALAGSPYDNTNLSNALNAKQDTLTAGTNITIDANNVISSTSYEGFFRGKYTDWAEVPTDSSAYLEDFNGNTTPLKNDYMVITDASDYVNPDFSNDPENVAFQRNSSQHTINVIVGNNIISVHYTEIQRTYKTIRKLFTSKGYTDIGCEWLKLKYIPGAPGNWYITSDSSYYENNELVSANTDHFLMNTKEPTTSMFYFSRNAGVAPIALFGGWRFRYVSEWSDKGKNGWKPEYQIENVLPVATPTEQGIAKLYTTTGSNTDGSMTQKSITDAIGAKQDTISDLATIRSNAQAGKAASDTIATYGNIVTHNVAEFATAAQGAKADTAVQPGDLATVATTGSYNDLSNKPTIPTVGNGTITITQGGITKGTFTTNQSGDTTVALDAGGGGIGNIDNITITANADDEIQAVAVIDQNTGIAKTWTGTMAEYEAIVTKDPETEYIITDDIGGPATEIGQITEVLNNKVDKGHQVVEFQEPTADNGYTWYRKYADGWVEQGGRIPGNIGGTYNVSMPVEMADTNYNFIGTGYKDSNDNGFVAACIDTSNMSTTGFRVYTRYTINGSTGSPSQGGQWQVSGMAA